MGHPRPPEIKRLLQLLTFVGSETLTSKTHLVSPLCNPINVLWAIRCLPLARLLCPAPPFLGLLSFARYTFALGGASPLNISLTLGIAALLRTLGRLGGSFGIASALDIATLLCPLRANCTIPFRRARTRLRLCLPPPFNAAWAFRRSGRAIETGTFWDRTRSIHLALRRSASTGAGTTHTGLPTTLRSTPSPLTTAWALRRSHAPVENKDNACESWNGPSFHNHFLRARGGMT
jgi:hypothetical protein